MKNIHSCRWDLMVTSPQPLSDNLKDRILTLNPRAVFLQTENVGYDLWPFIAALRQVNLDEYDMVIKIHTKNEDGFSITLNGMEIDGRKWKELLVDAMLGSRDRFSALMKIFTETSDAGIAYNRQLGLMVKGVHPEDCEMLNEEMSRLGIRLRGRRFCAGTMFAARSVALKFLQDDRITASCFAVSGNSHGGATLAHVYERLIPLAIQSQGYRCRTLFDSTRDAVKFTLKDAVTPVLEWLFSIDYHGGKDRKCVTIFGFKSIWQVARQ